MNKHRSTAPAASTARLGVPLTAPADARIYEVAQAAAARGLRIVAILPRGALILAPIHPMPRPAQ